MPSEENPVLTVGLNGNILQLNKIARRKFLLQIYLGRIVFMIYRQEYIILIQKIIENLLIDPVVHLVVQYGYIITQAVMKG